MKKIILSIALATICAFAASAPKTHDGFFASASLGLGYQNMDYVFSDYSQFSGNTSGLATDIDIKIGGNLFTDNFLLHMTLAGTTSMKTFPIYDDDRDASDARANLSFFGIGATYYFLDNFLATASIGVGQLRIDEVPPICGSVQFGANHPETTAGFAFQIGGGKEWWIADEWGIGATVAILYGTASNLADTKTSSFGISLRFTATYN